MKKQRKFKLVMNKVSVSKLNNVKGKGGDTVTESSVTFPCIISVDAPSCQYHSCRTGLTVLDGSLGAC